jgi:predicted nucleic acid-binding Zn ribbon protein
MSDTKKRLQKWRRREKQQQLEASAAIYPHYHCLVCDQIIEKGDSYEILKKSTDKSVYYQHFCSKECYEKYAGKPGKKRGLKIWVLYIGIGVALAVIVILIIIFGGVFK